MRIRTVEYARLMAMGNYENQKLSAMAEVEEGEAPEEALDKLRDWVVGMLSEERRVREAITTRQGELRALEYQIAQTKRHHEREVEWRTEQLRRLREVWKNAVAFLAAHGIVSTETIPIPEDLGALLTPLTLPDEENADDDIPF